MGVILSARGVTKHFNSDGWSGTPILQDIHLDVMQGEFLCLLGASGCGKSTMLNLFAGFEKPTAGTVLLHGLPIAGIEPRCGMLFQSYALFPWRTVRRNVAFALARRGIRGARASDEIDRLLNLVHLDGSGDAYPSQLSGGMQQRVALARCLAADPDVLLMDEPFAALDALTREVLQGELQRIHRESGKTIVFITHSIEEALLLADRIVVMAARPGRITAMLENRLPRACSADVRSLAAFTSAKESLRERVARRA